MKFVTLALAMLFSVFASAAAIRPTEKKPEDIHYIFLISPEIRYERGSDQLMAFRNVLNLGVGIRLEKTSVLFEYSKFADTGVGNATLSIDRSHQEYTLWLNYDFYQVDSLNFYAGLGAGAFQESVTTRLNNISVKDNGDMQLLGGASLGLRFLVIDHLSLGVEGRLIAGQNFDPNPRPSGVVNLGFEF